MGMEQDPQKLIELAGEVWDAERKYGLIGRTASRILGRKAKIQPAEAIDYRQELVKAALENAVDKIAGLDLTVEQAFQIVGQVVSFDDLEKLNSTWQGHWSEGASKVGIDDEERRTWWARLLAGEIQQPGTFSLRTLAVMDTLSTAEARLFTKLCGYVWNPANPVVILPTDDSSLWKPSFTESSILESIGLVKFNSLAGFNWGPLEDSVKELSSQGRSFPTVMQMSEDVYSVLNTPDKLVKLRCGSLALTDVGKEMFRLTKPDYSLLYRDEIVSDWRQSYTVHQLPVVAVPNS